MAYFLRLRLTLLAAVTFKASGRLLFNSCEAEPSLLAALNDAVLCMYIKNPVLVQVEGFARSMNACAF